MITVPAEPFFISCSKEKTSLSAFRTGLAHGIEAFALGTSRSKANEGPQCQYGPQHDEAFCEKRILFVWQDFPAKIKTYNNKRACY